MNEYIKLLIWALVILAIFGFMWRKGYLRRLSAYVDETRDELRKCSWPTIEELKGATVVVLVATSLIGVFTVVVSFVITKFIQIIT